MLLRKKLLIIVSALFLSAILFAAVILPSKYVTPILMYHHIQVSSRDDRLSVSPANFKKQMDFFSKQKYKVISLEELTNLIKGQKPIPPKTVVITFDDGYEDNYIYAFPVLKKYNFPAVIFIITDKIGKTGYADWAEIKEMSENNIEIGSHSQSHPWLPDLKDEKKLQEEILWSKKILEYKLDCPLKFFCYPGGGISNQVKQAVIDAGYLGACATHPGAGYDKYDLYALRRIKITDTDNLISLWVKTSGYYTLFKKKK